MNGVDADLACGSSKCVSGSRYECDAGAEIRETGETCTSETPPQGGGTLGRDAATSTPAPAATATCNWTNGLFQCGDRECAKSTLFCLKGDATFGASCKSFGGEVSPCPSCDLALEAAKATNACGKSTATCSGDETTGVTVRCVD
ncbi:MAG: hypothetical protein U0169_06945 [Polyangiaceae bacterium]